MPVVYLSETGAIAKWKAVNKTIIISLHPETPNFELVQLYF